MLLIYRQAGRIVTVNTSALVREDRVPPPPPEAYGRPWSQVPAEEKMALLADERAWAEREGDRR